MKLRVICVRKLPSGSVLNKGRGKLCWIWGFCFWQKFVRLFMRFMRLFLVGLRTRETEKLKKKNPLEGIGQLHGRKGFTEPRFGGWTGQPDSWLHFFPGRTEQVTRTFCRFVAPGR